MFWVWFFLVGIIGNWLAGKTTIPRLRRAAPLKLLKTLVWVGIACFTMVGIFAGGNRIGSWFINFLAATLSWAAFVSVPELIRRKAIGNNKDYYRDLENEIAESEKNVPRVLTPDQAFLKKTNFEFPLAPKEPDTPPEEWLADSLAEPVAMPAAAGTGVELPPASKTILDVEQSQVRSELLAVLHAFCKAGSAVEVEQELVDVLEPAPPVPSLFSTPILEAGPVGTNLGVTSRFGSTPARTLDEPLLSADLDLNPGESEKPSLEGFTYKPKLIESKFSKPIE